MRLLGDAMRLLNNISISSKVFAGFGIILLLLLIISAVNLSSLYRADKNFKQYRSLARQTNANGRIQANMLMTRIVARNFVFNASGDNILGFKNRARMTIEMIEAARSLTTETGFQLILDGLEQEMKEYVAGFDEVTVKQAEWDTLVHDTLNVADSVDNVADSVDNLADSVERQKLEIKTLQDELGSRAEAQIDRAVAVTLVLAAISIVLAVVAAWLIGFGVSRPIRLMANNMRQLADEQQMVVQEISAAKQAAEAANLARSTFLANMSHELRTPLNAILGYSEMLIEEAEEQQREEFIADLKKINQAGNHLLSLINDVLELSRIESGKMQAVAELLNVGTLIDQVSDTALPLMQKNNNHFKIERGDNPGNACQDVTKLRQSLLNLLSNAAKFTHAGNITLQVGRQSQPDGEWLIFSVSDTGIGIPADKLDEVFEAFSQADDSSTRNYGGTGLGLAISRRFCQMLGGDLSVTSQPGEGSTFSIRVPAVLPGAEMPQQTPPQSG